MVECVVVLWKAHVFLYLESVSFTRIAIYLYVDGIKRNFLGKVNYQGHF